MRQICWIFVQIKNSIYDELRKVGCYCKRGFPSMYIYNRISTNRIISDLKYISDYGYSQEPGITTLPDLIPHPNKVPCETLGLECLLGHSPTTTPALHAEANLCVALAANNPVNVNERGLGEPGGV